PPAPRAGSSSTPSRAAGRRSWRPAASAGGRAASRSTSPTSRRPGVGSPKTSPRTRSAISSISGDRVATVDETILPFDQARGCTAGATTLVSLQGRFDVASRVAYHDGSDSGRRAYSVPDTRG